MSYKTFIVKKVAKHVLSNTLPKQNAQDQDTQNIIASSSTDSNAQSNNSGGKWKKNKWKIPPNLTQKEAKILKNFKKRAYCYDVSCCNCCGLKIGLDPIIGLLPFIGDFMGAWLALMLLKSTKELELPHFIMMQMAMNILIDFLVGLVPFIGDFIDFLYKANTRNSIILEDFLVDRSKNRSVLMENGAVEVIRVT